MDQIIELENEQEILQLKIKNLKADVKIEELEKKLLNALVDRDKYKNRVIAISRKEQIKNRSIPQFEAVNY